ncbi:DUF1822 family protein [Picosynechococcus sp. PCC 7117]|uniref:DUF1822 family protein n=1 Tax=Picosynechococcus sp. PCC 7117 TaxID=195498 RepID=UPI000810D76C|nr:DUF1822 family protein [Picosynechococcus sp. PCC 7117]ANV89099.1 hypothetical protein AWQ22_16040 [Picosynechococcus sp. PCC 7117]
MNTPLLDATTGLTVTFKPEQQYLARRYAAQQLSEAQAESVYLGTLARTAVQDFLSELHITTELSTSNSDHPLLRQLNPTFDLELPDFGPLICIPVQGKDLAEGDRLPLPFQAAPALGYVVVLFSGETTSCRLYGYLPTADLAEDATDFSLSQLQDIKQLQDYLYGLEEYLEILPELMATEVFVSTADAIVMLERLKDLPLRQRKVALLQAYPQLDETANHFLAQLNTLWGDFVALGDWLKDQWQGAWANLQDEFATLMYPDLNLSLAGQTRSTSAPVHQSLCHGISMLSLGGQDLRVVIRCLPKDENSVDIAIEVYPQEGAEALPVGLSLRLLDDTDAVLYEERVDEGDRQLSLELEGETGEGFLLEFSFSDTLVQKYFQI